MNPQATDNKLQTRDLLSSFEATSNSSNPGKNYLLSIGIDQYQHCPPLHNAVKDAADFQQVLTERYHFKAENIFAIYDDRATRKTILQQFRRLVQLLTPADNLVIYYSGHGIFDEVWQKFVYELE